MGGTHETVPSGRKDNLCITHLEWMPKLSAPKCVLSPDSGHTVPVDDNDNDKRLLQRSMPETVGKPRASLLPTQGPDLGGQHSGPATCLPPCTLLRAMGFSSGPDGAALGGGENQGGEL